MWRGGRLKLAALQKKDGALKLSHFRRVKQLGSGDVGLVDLVQVQGDPESRYAMKTLEKREMLERNKVLHSSWDALDIEAVNTSSKLGCDELHNRLLRLQPRCWRTTCCRSFSMIS